MDPTGRALIGHMGEQEALAFLKGMCNSSGRSDADLKALWEQARKAVSADSEYIGQPEIREIAAAHKDHLDAVSKDPLFAETVGTKKWTFQLVEIDKVVAFQQFVDTDHAATISKGADVKDITSLVLICLPESQPRRGVPTQFNQRENSFTVVAPGADLRVCGNSQGEDPVTGRKMLGFVVGWGNPYVQVIHFQGRYFLKNGYHRLIHLRRQGVTHAPCILIEGENWEDLGLREGFFNQQTVMSSRPPLLAHFASDAIAPPVALKPRAKVIRIKAEEIPIFATPANILVEAAPASAVAAAPTQDGHYENFKVVSEEWNIYQLADGTVLKIRQCLNRIDKGAVAGQFAAKLSDVVIVTMPPPKLKGKPSTQLLTPAAMQAAIVEPSVQFKKLKETTAEYETESGSKAQIRVTLVSVARTSKFNADGDPIYLVNSQTALQVAGPQR